jgi:DNA-binding NtrC family response regulator
VDVRVISASHKDLCAEIEAGRFREDLFYRLYVGVIEVPPLRARGDDIITLAERFLREAALRQHKPLAGFTPAARALLRVHKWPGNVRELQNEAERVAISAEGPLVDVCDLSARVLGSTTRVRTGPANVRSQTLLERFAELDTIEKALVQEALAEADGNASKAARLLGITRIMLMRRLEKSER